MQNMQNQQLDEFGNPIQQPVQAPNPMMPNRAGAPPRSMNDLVYQPLSNQGSMAYQKGKTPPKAGVGSVSPWVSTPNEKTPGFSDTKTLSGSTLKKMEKGKYDNAPKKQKLG